MKMTIKGLTQRVKTKIKAVGAGLLTAFLMLQNSTVAYAAGIGDSQIAKGTEKLIQDATTWKSARTAGGSKSRENPALR